MKRHRKKINRIYVFGSVGSGKSTYSQKLAERYALPVYGLDHLIWGKRKKNEPKRSREERIKLIEEVCHQPEWIIEGAQFELVERTTLLKQANCVYVLDLPAWQINYRIVTRWLKQNLHIEASSYSPTIEMLKKMFRWQKKYQREKAVYLKKITDSCHKVIVIKSHAEMKRLLKSQEVKKIIGNKKRKI